MANITASEAQRNGQNIDYNYPSLNRCNLMNLSTINNNDTQIRKFKQLDTNRNWSTNLYNMDIEGSVPKKFGVLHEKVDFINKLDDIERTCPKQLHVKLNKQEYYLKNEDIEGSSPQCVKFKTNRERFNPLEPKYNLCKVEEIPVPEPKFIRDSIRIDDIDGAHPRKYFKWETRKGMFSSDIEGSSPRKAKLRQTKYSNFDYSDVTNDQFKTRRCVDPLDPIYEVKYKNGEHYVHGKIEGSKPVTFSQYNYPDPYNLKVLDIDGTQAGTKNRINKFTAQNYNLITKDIRGALSGSLKKGITTERQTNPLTPNYALPGQIELAKNNNPYGTTLFSKSAKVRQNIEQSNKERYFTIIILKQ
jgi:hypothetical protein